MTASRSSAPSSSGPARRTPLRRSPSVQVVLVPFRSGEAVRRHPDIQPWIDAGWTVRRAAPRLVEAGRTKLLVILEHAQPEPVTTTVARTARSAA